jgi:hypothetical protein
MYVKKILLVILIFTIIFLSGCLDKLETHGREICLSTTHHAETSILNCTTQQDCITKMFSADLLISKNVPKELHNKIITYKNNIASATYYFNKSKKNLDEINNACYKRIIPKNVVDNVNDLFFYLANIFNYLDRSSETSIEILKDYAIFLKNQDVHLISEEDIYLDFIEINKNLNELADIYIFEETYIGNLKKNSKEINDIAKELGFNKTYVSKISYLDLFGYYYDFSEEVQEEKTIPKLSLSTSYILGRISNIEILDRINKQLTRTDKYNLYIALDKHMGVNNSTFVEFKEINNRTVNNLTKIFTKITELEKKISEEKEYLDDKHFGEYVSVTYDYKYNKLTFGKYLQKLKELLINIEQNKITTEKQEEEIKKELHTCEQMIQNKELLKNYYLKKLIEEYLEEDNYFKKKEICDKIINNKDIITCEADLLKVLETEKEMFKEYGFLEYKQMTQKECNEILGIFEYKLRRHEKIILINQILLEIDNLLIDYETLNHLDKENQTQMAALKQEINTIKNQRNVEKMIESDKITTRLNKIKEDLQKINNTLLEKFISQNITIEYFENSYYLAFNNPLKKEFQQVRIKTEEVDFSEIKSKTQNLRITKDYITFYAINKNNNKYEIEYKNNQKITTKIIDLKCGLSLIETKIENEVIGLISTLNLGQVVVADPTKYIIDQNNNIQFITEQINRLIYQKKLISKEKLFVDISETTSEKIVISEKYNITNESYERVVGDLGILNVFDEMVIVKKNEETIDSKIQNDVLRINVNLDVFESLIIDVFRMKEKQAVLLEMQEFFSKIHFLKNSIFEDVKNKINNLDIPLKDIEDYELQEIKKIYFLETEINEIYQLQKRNEQTEDQVNIIINELLKNEKYITEISNIQKNKYNNISETYQKITALKEKIKEEENIEEINKKEEIKTEFENYFKIKEDYKISTKEIDQLFDNYRDEEQKEETLKEIKQKINVEMKSIADKLYDQIRIVDEITIKDIDNLKNEVDWLYEHINLKEMYDVKYYPKITIADSERLVKKAQFLETIMLKEQISSFKNEYSSQNYQNAILKIPEVTTQRLYDIKSEKEYVEKEINNIRIDSRELLNTYLQKQHTPENTKTIETAKEMFDKKQYLYVIYLLKSLSQDKNQIPKINLELGVYLLIIILLCVGYLYFKKEKKKVKETMSERKQKIIRRY